MALYASDSKRREVSVSEGAQDEELYNGSSMTIDRVPGRCGAWPPSSDQTLSGDSAGQEDLQRIGCLLDAIRNTDKKIINEMLTNKMKEAWR